MVKWTRFSRIYIVLYVLYYYIINIILNIICVCVRRLTLVLGEKETLLRTMDVIMERTQDFTDSAYTRHEHRENILTLCDRVKTHLDQLMRAGARLVSYTVGNAYNAVVGQTYVYHDKFSSIYLVSIIFCLYLKDIQLNDSVKKKTTLFSEVQSIII